MERSGQRSNGLSPTGQAGEGLRASPLGTLEQALREQLLRGAQYQQLSAPQLYYRQADAPDRVTLVLSGLARVFMMSAQGRQITVRYAHRGDLLGVAALLAGPPPASVQALTDCELLHLDAAFLRELAGREASVALLLAEETARQLYGVLAVLAGQAFGSVRQRLAWHLLELAAEQPEASPFTVPGSQQELADAVGSVREVVARTLQDWRASGVVATGPGGVQILDPAALHRELGRQGET
ncbi:Crp/Fnr family transcriptional regulator [Deinococcus frigens]|uniref:Crp/Fnr family transcriptional regulator n=1 Tax=Deinococcus frigens TaxID=249403 RepID=UPI0006898F31|nr:Crp/Fnr family transcriptional regulator [Deinococcus frigens]